VKLGNDLDAALSHRLFTGALDAKLKGAEGSASQPLRDLETVRAFLSGHALLAFFDAPWSPLFVVGLILIHPAYGLLAVGGFAVIVALAVRSEMATRAALREAGHAARLANDQLDAFSRNAEAIHAMGMGRELERLWLDHHEAGVAWQCVASDKSAVLSAVAKQTRMALQIAILGVGAFLVIRGEISAGVMIAASILMARALAPAESAIGQWSSFVGARAAYQRLKEHLAAAGPGRAEATALPAPKGHVLVDKVFMRHPGSDQLVLNNVSFELKPGEALGLVGPSGAGKSTLARLLVGLARPTAGSIRIDGAEIAGRPRDEIGPHIGYMPQAIELMAGTIADNICRFGARDDARVVEAARRAGAHDLILRLPQGYDTIVAEGGRSLSGGQRQRIALACALYGNGRLVVLDEPNSNLDADGETALRHAILDLKRRGATVVVVSHKPSVLAAIDRVLVLREGRAERLCPVSELLAPAGVTSKASKRAAAPARRPQQEENSHAVS
jgi:PrtD family type I secretion system ABC transporter